MSDERSVSYYLGPLGRHSTLIVLLVLLAAFGTLGLWLASGSTSPYEAEALILFKSFNNGRVDLSQTSQPQFEDTTLDIVRLQKNVGLLSYSMDIATKVADKAAASSDPNLKALAAEGPLVLRDSVSVVPKGDFVSVKAQGPTAEVATWLANTWAQEAVLQVNSTYAAPSPNVSQAVNDMKATLDKDQQALQDYMAKNPISEITQELSQTIAFLDSASTSSADNDMTLFDAERQSLRAQIGKSYSTVAALDQQLSEIQALRSRIQESPDDQSSLYANQIALMVLLNKVVAGNAGSQVQLQLNISDLSKGPLSKSSQLNDVDSTASAVRKLQNDIRSQISNLEERLNAPVAQSTPGTQSSGDSIIQSYVQRQSELEVELERRKFETDQLEKSRDIDRETYDLLRNRAAEQQVNQTVSGIVDIGQRANEMETSRTHNSLKALVLDIVQWSVIALVLGVILAYVLSLLWPRFSFNGVVAGTLRRPRATRASEGDRTATIVRGD